MLIMFNSYLKGVSENIGETVKKHLAIVPNSIAAHPLIGCDKVGA